MNIRKKIRELLPGAEIRILTYPENFAKWLLILRGQENLFHESSTGASEQYKYSEDFVKELFWQITCVKYLQVLGISITDENLDDIENLIKKYRNITSIQTLMPALTMNTEKISLSAWEVSQYVDDLINNLSSIYEDTINMQNFVYLLRHLTGHDVRPTIRRFASNLSNDLKVKNKDTL